MKNFLYTAIFFNIAILFFLHYSPVNAQMVCCNACYGGVCQVQANCVYGGQTCGDECQGQGAACGFSCTYDSNCPGYPYASCVGGACVQDSPTTVPNSPIPTPSGFSGNCPYCTNPHESWANFCTTCYKTLNDIGTSTGPYTLGIYRVYAGTWGSGHYYKMYFCAFEGNELNNVCATPYVILGNPAWYNDANLGTGLHSGCWPAGCGPYPDGSAVLPTATPTSTPSPTYTPSPTPTLGCNSSCPGNGFNCGNGLWCSGQAGNVCRNASCAGQTDCDCAVGDPTSAPTPTPICGDNQCDASECLTCAVDCSGSLWCSSVPTLTQTLTPSPTPAYTFDINPNPCTMTSATKCEATVEWDTINYPYVTVEDSTTTIGSGPTGSATVTIDTTTCVTYYLKSNGSTIDSESLCPQKNWVKLKNASFQTRSSSFNNPIPDTPQAYDEDDTTDAQFIIGEAGPVTAPRIMPYPATVSSTSWVKENYKPRIVMDANKTVSYAQSRKDHEKIAASQISTIQTNTIYRITDDSLTITSDAPFENKNVVIISTGTITFDIAGGEFNPNNGNVAFIAQTINLYNTAANNNHLSQIRALIIADTVNTGSADNTTLKIIGNIATKSLSNGRSHSTSSNTRPSIFVALDPSLYISLLTYISVSKYEWKQLN